MNSNSANPAAPLTILDTNVLLDAFLFEGDPNLQPLRAAVRNGDLRVITTPWAANEFRMILRLDKVPGPQDRKDIAWDLFTEFVTVMDLPEKTQPVPKCADRDDQEFIDLAVATAARWLLSRDKKVLKLRRRFNKLELPTHIIHPLDWCALISSQSDTTA